MTAPRENSLRHHWSAEDKLAVLRLRRLGSLRKSVAEICRDVGITRKTFYEWERNYLEGGLDGLGKRPRRESACLSRRSEIIAAVLTLAREWPNWGSAAMAAELSKQGFAISAQTLRSVLSRHGLDSKDSRRVAVERALIQGEYVPSFEQLKTLFKLNPCIGDWYQMGGSDGRPVGIETIPLDCLSTKLPNHHVAILVDFDSLYAVGSVVSRTDRSFLFKVSGNAKQHFQRQDAAANNVIVFGRVPLALVSSLERYVIGDRYHMDGAIQKSDLGVWPGALTVLRTRLRSSLFPAIRHMQTAEEVEEALQTWLREHNYQGGPVGYPTFGRKPSDILASKKRPAEPCVASNLRRSHKDSEPRSTLLMKIRESCE